MKVVHEIAPSKEIGINNNKDCFDREVGDLIYVWEKLFLKFNRVLPSKLPVSSDTRFEFSIFELV